MPRYVIHIGPHKTGSTYLQQRFRAAQDVMAARGIVFPEIWQISPRNPSQLVLVEMLRAGRMAALEAQFAALNASDAAIILLSAEDLANLDEAAFTRLEALTAGHGVELVFVLRRWSDVLPSVWQESIKHGHIITLPQFLLRHLANPAGSPLLNMDMKLSRMAAIFGRSALRLVCYDQLRAGKIDLFTHFARNFLDWPDPPAEAQERISNPSMDPVDTELIRVFNAMHQQRGGARGADMRNRFNAASRQMDLTLPRAAIAQHMAAMRFNDDGPAMRPLLRKLSETYLPLTVAPRPEQRLFQPAVRDLAYANAEYLLVEGVIPALQTAFASLCAT